MKETPEKKDGVLRTMTDTSEETSLESGGAGKSGSPPLPNDGRQRRKAPPLLSDNRKKPPPPVVGIFEESSPLPKRATTAASASAAERRFHTLSMQEKREAFRASLERRQEQNEGKARALGDKKQLLKTKGASSAALATPATAAAAQQQLKPVSWTSSEQPGVAVERFKGKTRTQISASAGLPAKWKGHDSSTLGAPKTKEGKQAALSADGPRHRAQYFKTAPGAVRVGPDGEEPSDELDSRARVGTISAPSSDAAEDVLLSAHLVEEGEHDESERVQRQVDRRLNQITAVAVVADKGNDNNGNSLVCKVALIAVAAVLAVLAIAVGAAVGTQRRRNSAIANSSPDVPDVLAVATPSPSNAAASSAVVPSSSPTKIPPPRSFVSASELYQAVDRYLIDGSPDSDIAEEFGHPIRAWNVSAITDFSHLFSIERNGAAGYFNEPLAEWDVSGATSLAGMFLNAVSFNQDLSAWDVSRVRDFSLMFLGAWAFDTSLAAWDVSSATSLAYMLAETPFNGDISGWDTSRVTRTDGMFAANDMFNGELDTWDTSRVRNMTLMFHQAESFNQNLSGWNTSAVESIAAMFLEASSFNGDVSGWNTSAVRHMEATFSESSFDGDLSRWDVSRVRNMSYLFSYSEFNGNVSAWDTSRVEDMTELFSESKFDGDLSRWDVSNVYIFDYMFYLALDFQRGNISAWDTSRAVSMEGMFEQARSFDEDLCSWGRRLHTWVHVRNMFRHSGCPRSEEPSLSGSSPGGPFCRPCDNSSLAQQDAG